MMWCSCACQPFTSEEFNPAEIAGIIPRHGVTFLLLVPTAILLLVEHPASGSADFSSVRELCYGASPIAEALVEQARVTFPNARLWQAYGLTEASGGGTILPPEAHDLARASCGLAAGAILASSCASSTRLATRCPPARWARSSSGRRR